VLKRRKRTRPSLQAKAKNGWEMGEMSAWPNSREVSGKSEQKTKNIEKMMLQWNKCVLVKQHFTNDWPFLGPIPLESAH